MAETIKKRISDLDAASQPLGGTELAEISQGGVSKKVTLTNIFGSGWWAALRAAFSSFVAPEATHATDSDTVGGETKAQLHDATKLTGAVPLASIPAELTGKNAATATLATTATNANTVAGVDPVNGNAGTWGSKEFANGETWIIPKGLYMMVAYNTASHYAYLEIYRYPSTPNLWNGTVEPSGLIISDGANFRIRGVTPDAIPATVWYRKLA